MINYLSTFVNTDGNSYPDTASVNSSGPGTTDGTEFVKAFIDDLWGYNQALLNYTGDTPTGSTEADGASQRLDSILKIAANIETVSATGTYTLEEWNKKGIVLLAAGVVTLTLAAGVGTDESNRILLLNQSGGTVTINTGGNPRLIYDGDMLELLYNTVSTNFEGLSGQQPVIQAAGIPTASPNFIGQIYMDTTNGWRYIATGVSAVSDWHIQYAYGTVTVTAGGGDIIVDLGGNWINGELTIYRSQSTSDYIAGWIGVKFDTTYDAITNGAYTLNQILMHRSSSTGNYHENVEKTTNTTGVPKSATTTTFTLDDDGVQTSYVKWVIKA